MSIEVQSNQPKFNKREYMRVYMKNYLKEYYKTHPKKDYSQKTEYCELCDKFFSKSSMINHKKSLKHRHRLLIHKINIENLPDDEY